jgi:hypothetical protein
MAGFTDQRGNFINSIMNSVKKIGSFGMAYGDLVVKNSQAVGVTEAQFLKNGGITDESFLYTLRKSDSTSKQYIEKILI